MTKNKTIADILFDSGCFKNSVKREDLNFIDKAERAGELALKTNDKK